MDNINYIDVNRNAYDVLAEDYRRRLNEKGEFEEPAFRLVDLPVKHLAKNHNRLCQTVLEIGPGSGEVLAEFERLGFRTTAVDISANIIRVASQVSHSTVFINSNVLDLNFKEDQFDVVYAGAVVHLFSLEDAQSLLRKIHSWVKSDGVLFLNTTLHEFSSEGFLEKTDYAGNVSRYRRNWEENEFLQFIQVNGFNVVEKAFTNEKDRGKRWIGLVLKKRQ